MKRLCGTTLVVGTLAIVLGTRASAGRTDADFQACSHRLVRHESSEAGAVGATLYWGAGHTAPIPADLFAAIDLPADAWQPCVDSFDLGDGRRGLHVAAFAIFGRGSDGSDLFLSLVTGRVGDASRVASIARFPSSQGRGSSMTGCRPALSSRFLLGDIDADGRLDLGVERRRVDCRETGEHWEPVYAVEPIRWHRNGDAAFALDARYDGRLGQDLLALPPIGFVVSPVDVVLDHLIRQPEPAGEPPRP